MEENDEKKKDERIVALEKTGKKRIKTIGKTDRNEGKGTSANNNKMVENKLGGKIVVRYKQT